MKEFVLEIFRKHVVFGNVLIDFRECLCVHVGMVPKNQKKSGRNLSGSFCRVKSIKYSIFLKL